MLMKKENKVFSYFFTEAIRPAAMIIFTYCRYAFYLPIVAMAWRHAAGYQPLVLLVGQQWRSPGSGSRLAAVMDALKASDARVQAAVHRPFMKIAEVCLQ